MIKTHYICPFCFEKLKISDVEFRCENTALKGDGTPMCPLEEDVKYSDFNGFRTPQKRRQCFKAEQKGMLKWMSMPAKGDCPTCGQTSRDKVCPKCHSRLPNDIEETEDLFFAMIGAKEAGKSHYLAVLINIIATSLTLNFPFSISAANDETSRRYKSDFKKRVYEDKETITATQSGMIDRAVRSPLIYHIKFYRTSAFSKKKIPTKTITIAFFDTAGEDLNDEDIMLAVNRYIYNSSGIIFLLDPLQIQTVRDSLPIGTPLPEKNTEMETIIARTTRLIRRAKDLKANDKIKIPLAVAFTKIDALQPVLDPSSYLNYPSRHADLGKFDIVDCENVSREMEAILKTWSGNDLTQQISVNFEDYAYFGLSALGCNPQQSRKIDKIVPNRVEDPFLWLLWKHGLIKGFKE